MGRIKTKLVKRLTIDLVKQYKDMFTNDFTKNKEVVVKLLSGTSKKIRNVVAGYVTRLMKHKEEIWVA